MVNAQRNDRPLQVALVVMIALAVLAGGSLAVCAATGHAWAVSGLVGFGGAAALGFYGWWTAHRALGADVRTWVRLVMGGFGIRFVACAIFAGVCLGAGIEEPVAFVTGLLSGIAAFMLIELIGVTRIAPDPARGATDHGS